MKLCIPHQAALKLALAAQHLPTSGEPYWDATSLITLQAAQAMPSARTAGDHLCPICVADHPTADAWIERAAAAIKAREDAKEAQP